MTDQKTATPDFEEERLWRPVSWTFMMLIKLNDKGIRVYMRSRYRYRTPMDWPSRTGSIVKYSRNRSIAYVFWNGNRSSDRVSVDLIETAASLVPDVADALVGDCGVNNGFAIERWPINACSVLVSTPRAARA